jgi:hypothetical protein
MEQKSITLPKPTPDQAAYLAMIHKACTEYDGSYVVGGPQKPAPTTESGWLVERPPTPDTHPTWWHPQHGWSKDAGRGLRFARKKDAEAYIAGGRFTLDAVATEHLWIGDRVITSVMKDYVWRVAAMLRFLREHDGECLGDHPDWLAKIDALLNETPG